MASQNARIPESSEPRPAGSAATAHEAARPDLDPQAEAAAWQRRLGALPEAHPLRVGTAESPLVRTLRGLPGTQKLVKGAFLLFAVHFALIYFSSGLPLLVTTQAIRAAVLAVTAGLGGVGDQVDGAAHRRQSLEHARGIRGVALGRRRRVSDFGGVDPEEPNSAELAAFERLDADRVAVDDRGHAHLAGSALSGLGA